MDDYFKTLPIVSKIHYTLKGFTKPGKYCYENRKTYELGFRLFGESHSTAQGKTHLVKKNDVVFKPKGKSDVCLTQSGVEFCSVWFDIEDSPSLDFHVFTPKDPTRIMECFRALEKEERKNGASLECYSLLYRILSLLQDSPCYLTSKSQSILQEATDLMDENFKDSEFSVDTVLQELGVSASLLRKLFHTRYAKPPIQYLVEKRIDYAKKLLFCSEYSVGEISELCGFDSPFYFSRIFKKYTGFAPLYYRQHNER